MFPINGTTGEDRPAPATFRKYSSIQKCYKVSYSNRNLSSTCSQQIASIWYFNISCRSASNRASNRWCSQ